ncbi:MAG: DUF444 family protein [Cyanobacteria bacterium]|nr:DUF444 family protein [Cyanobacteriota bacterium]
MNINPFNPIKNDRSPGAIQPMGSERSRVRFGEETPEQPVTLPGVPVGDLFQPLSKKGRDGWSGVSPLLDLPPGRPARLSQTVATMSLPPGMNDPDARRFIDIMRGKARKDLGKFINPNKMKFPDANGKTVQVPMPDVRVPRLRPAEDDDGGAGEGDGPPGMGKPGTEKGEHDQEQWSPPISRNQIAQDIIEELKLPNLEPKGSRNLVATSEKWTSVSPHGRTLVLRDTLIQILKATSANLGRAFNPETDMDKIVVRPQDLRFRAPRPDQKPTNNAVIIYIKDISGSITSEMTEAARTTNFYLETVIGKQFGESNARIRGEEFTDEMFGAGTTQEFIQFDTEAEVVSQKKFYESTSGGGTKISSGLEAARKLIAEKYPPDDYNIYIYIYSDGDNSGSDDQTCIQMMKEMEPDVNEIGYINLNGRYASGGFKRAIEDAFGANHHKMRTSAVDESNPNIRQVLIDMLGERKAKGASS